MLVELVTETLSASQVRHSSFPFLNVTTLVLSSVISIHEVYKYEVNISSFCIMVSAPMRMLANREI